MTSKKIFLGMLAMLLAFSSVFGGGSSQSRASSGTNLRMMYWDPSQEEVLTRINNMFIEKHPGVTITLENIPGDAYDQVLRTRLLSGDGPDVYFFWGSRLWEQGRDGHYGDITDEPFTRNVAAAFLGSATYNGRVYGIPLDTAANGVFYNKSVFERAGVAGPPRNYAEFLDICQKIKDIGIEPIAMGGADLWVQLHWLGPLYNAFVAARNPDIQADLFDGRTRFSTDPGFREMFARYKELIDRGYITRGALSTTHTQSEQEVADGNCGMIFMGNWVYGGLMAANPNARIGSFLLPNNEGRTVAGGAPDKGIGYWKDGKNIALAKELLAFYASPEINQIFCTATASLPCIIGAEPDLGETLKTHGSLVAAQQYMVTWMDIFYPVAMQDSWRKDAQSLLGGSITVDRLLANMDEAYNRDRNTLQRPSIR